MSASQTVRASVNPLIIDSNIEKLARGSNYYITATYRNTAATPVTLNEGTVLGRINNDTTNPTWVTNVRQATSIATDGSEVPIGLLYLGGQKSMTIAGSATVEVQILNKGLVNANLIELVGTGDTLDTLIPTYGPDITYRDALDRMLVRQDVTDISKFDN